MFYNVPELKPPPLSFPLFIFLSTSHARPHSVVTLLSLTLPLFPPLPSRCNVSLFWPSLLLPTSVHLPILSDFISHLPYYLSTFPLLHRPSLYSYITFPCSAFSLSLCVLFSLPLSPSRYLLLSAARMSLLWPSCQLPAPPVHTHPAHICTSMYMAMTVWRSDSANSKHKGRWEAGNDRRKVEWTER